MGSLQRINEPAVLTSWKEVAAYLGKGVRTVQRWEKQDGLPIRRIAGTSKIVVRRDELDQWLHAQPAQNGRGSQAANLHISGIRDGIQVAKSLRLKNAVLCHSLHTLMSQLVDECRRMANVCDSSYRQN